MKLKTDDAELVRAALTGDQDAYRKLYKRHRPFVVRAVYRYCKPSDLEDMVQIAFSQIFSKMRQWRGDSKFGTWAYRVAVNEAFMEHRKISSKVFQNATSIDAAGNDGLRDTPKWEPQSENRDIEIAGDGAKLRDAVEHLSRRYREVTQCRLQELTIEETARELSLSIGSIKAYRWRAEKRIREYIEEEAKKRKMESGYA